MSEELMSADERVLELMDEVSALKSENETLKGERADTQRIDFINEWLSKDPEKACRLTLNREAGIKSDVRAVIDEAIKGQSKPHPAPTKPGDES